jgi:hypothetical protein
MRTAVICVCLATFVLLCFFLVRNLRPEATPPIKQPPEAPKQVTPAASALKPFTSSKETHETPEMRNARIMAEFNRSHAKFKPLADGFKSGGVKGMLSAQMDMLQGEYLEFFKSLGYSSEQSAQFLQMLKEREALARESLHALTESRSSGKLENREADQRKILQMDSELEQALGEVDPENWASG